MRTELTLMPTGACDMDCPFCSQKSWRAEFRDYQMSMDEVATICRRANELMPRRTRLYLTGGEPALWDNLEEGCRHIKSSGAFSVIWVSTNCVDADRWIEAIRAGLVDSVCTQLSNASLAGLKKLKAAYPSRVAVSAHRVIHKPVPTEPMVGVLPAKCGCDRLAVFGGKVYPCAPTFAIMKRMGWDMDNPRCWMGIEEDWRNLLDAGEGHLKTKKSRLNQRICRVCVANRKVWERIPNP